MFPLGIRLGWSGFDQWLIKVTKVARVAAFGNRRFLGTGLSGTPSLPRVLVATAADVVIPHVCNLKCVKITHTHLLELSILNYISPKITYVKHVSRVAGTMVARSSSVRATTRSNLS